MKFWTVAAAAILASTSAFAADLAGKKAAPVAPAPAKPLIAWPEPNLNWKGDGFGYLFGAKLMSNDVNRGISLTANRPGGAFYGEINYGWLYAGSEVWTVHLPGQPAAEVDVWAGVRPTWGPLTLDFGIVGYLYPGANTRYYLAGAGGPVLGFYTPGGLPTTAWDPNYFEVYAKATWALNDWLSIGYGGYYTPNWTNLGAKALYNEINAKVTLGETGFSISGAFGHQFLGRSRWEYGYSYVDPSQAFTGWGRGFKYASYNTWNVGGSYKWNQATLDLRYHGSSQGQIACAANTADPAANLTSAYVGVGKSNWCGHKFVASLGIEFSSSDFK